MRDDHEPRKEQGETERQSREGGEVEKPRRRGERLRFLSDRK